MRLTSPAASREPPSSAARDSLPAGRLSRRGAREVFVHADDLPAVRCPAAARSAWDPARAASCPLFARKFAPEAAAPAYRLLTSCDAALGIAPAPSCQMQTA
jgi:hypothetical protein